MKNSKLILTVLLGMSLGFVSCSQMEEDINGDTPVVTEGEVWTLKVEAGDKGDAVTKALSLNDNGTIKSEWVQGDEIKVHKYLDNGQLSLVANIGTLSAETSGAHTTFSGSLTSVDGLSVGTKIRLTYPNDMPDYRGQDGTLQYISDHCNYSYAEVTITELNTDTKVISTTNAAFKNTQAIWKIKFQDAEGADINVTSVTIVGDDMLSYYLGSNVAILGSINITLTDAVNEIWVAIHSMSENNNYVIKCVTEDSRQLSCVKKGNLQGGKYYTSTLRMQDLSSNYLTEINSVSDLVLLSNEVSIGKNYAGQTVTLMQNLDLSGVDNFQPIGLSSVLSFKGCFDGNHKTISNLKINATQQNVGLFGYLGRNSNVKDLTLDNCTITSTQSRVGGIAGYTDGNISGCTVSGSITGTGNVAGIVAYIDSGVSAPLTNCTFSGTVTATNGNAAGIVTLSNARIENCTNNGTIQGKNEVGGILAGGGSSPVTGCTNNGAVTGQKYIGGIVGISRDAVCTISDCTNNGHITATVSDAGGIAGRFHGYSSTLTISNCINTGTIEGASIVGGIAGYTKSTEKTLTYLNCSNSGSIISTGDSAGGLFGMVRIHRSSPSSPTTVLVISNSYNQGTVNGTDIVGGMIGQLLGGINNPQLSFDSCFSNAEVSASNASPHIGAYIGYFPSSYSGQSLTGSFVFTNSFYSSVPGCLAVDGADQDGVAGAYKIIAGTGVTVTPSTAEDLEHDGVKYFVSGKSVTVTLSGGSSYSAVDGSSNTIALTDLGGGSYSLSMPASDVTISAN